MDKSLKQANDIFNIITESFDNLEEAKQALVLLYVPDMRYKREAICKVIGKLEKHYNENRRHTY